MNVMNIFDPLPSNGAVTPVAQPAHARPMAANVFTLRKSGARPVSFAGRHLGSTNGYRLGTAVWHELNLYQTEDGRFVADIRVFSKAPGSKDLFHVMVADSLDEAICFFEGYDPKADVAADFDIDDPSLAPAELLVHAATLKYRIAETVTLYKAVLASFLKDLDNS